MIYITSAEQIRHLRPSPLQRTPVPQRTCRMCSGTRRMLVNKTGIVGEFVSKRCKVCKGGGTR
jgi:hypothetical protein